MCAAELRGVAVTIPTTHIRIPESAEPPTPEQERDEAVALASPHYEYDSYHDVRVVVSLLNAGLQESTEYTTLRMWLLGARHINGLIPSEVDFSAEAVLPLYNYITSRHSNKSRGAQLRLFNLALWYLSCHCSYTIQQGVLQWIYDYLTYHTVGTSCSTRVLGSTNYLGLELINLA